MASRVAAAVTGRGRGLGLIQARSTVFFLCDIQEKFRDKIHAFESMVQVAQKMSRVSKTMEIPLVVTEQYPKGLGHTADEIDIGHAALVESKTKFSMVTDGVAQMLRDTGARSVVLYGAESHVCVLQTCLELLDAQYDVHVLADGVSSINAPEIDIALGRMGRAGAHITSSESIILQLVGDSAAPHFKAISALVKEYQAAARQNKLLFRD
ncbi:hypothetical protein H4R18_000094 [Coemansia javaensis]|uniref:Isochorismatase-like domain-containing protein n=1 Tax=Coemansia javaensis TaxID=2761396 RepID=A0A9W8HIZ1_9FUNG|nr:hypothetical protein H4R18_000094 [Coemansia javaensis]